MANLRAIKKRITSVKSTQQITRAMKMVSGAKLRRAEERVRAFRPYVDELDLTLQSVLAREPELNHPLLQPGSTSAPHLYVLVTSDRGLCGAFNSNVIKQMIFHAEDNNLDLGNLAFYPVGKKGLEQLNRRKWNALATLTDIPEPPDAQWVAELAGNITEAFMDGAVSGVTLVYNQFINALRQEVTFDPLLPLSPGKVEVTNLTPFLAEPKSDELLDELAPRLVAAKLEGMLLDSIAGAHGARMAAMDAASSNASEMIEKLTLQFNRARQAAITGELLDIVNGTNAIE